MFKYLYSLDNSQPMSIEIVTNAIVTDGQLVAITAGLAGPAGANDLGILGIAMGGAALGGTLKVMLLTNKMVLRVPFVGVSKTSLVAADRFGTAFDIDSSQNLNLDDTTTGILRVVNYQNVSSGAGFADVVVKDSALWNAVEDAPAGLGTASLADVEDFAPALGATENYVSDEELADIQALGSASAADVAANQAASTASDAAGAVADLNALLAKLKAAGLMTADA